MIYSKIGKILNGEFKGWNISIIDDTEETGGYYILYWLQNDSNKGFDDWYENYEVLLINLKGIQIDWSNDDYEPRKVSEDEIK